MKIAFFNCQMRSVPPKKSGGIEKMMQYLIQGLTARGHSITLFGPADSYQPNIELVSLYPTELEMLDIDSVLKDEMNDKRTLELGSILINRQDEFDIVNNFCLESALPVLRDIHVPLVSRISEDLNSDAIKRLTPFKDLNYVSISLSQRRKFPDLNFVSNIYNGVDTSKVPFSDKHGEYILFIGRISQQKRPDLAIQIAKKLQKKLIILGKYKDEHVEEEYYRTKFLPALNENREYVEWVGEVKEEEVYEYSKNALVTIFPVDFDEPFGNAAVEAMATGCPVIAFNKGAYEETVVNGKTGFLVENVDEMAEKILLVTSLNREDCRNHISQNFSVSKMVDKYEKLYISLSSKPPKTASYTNYTPVDGKNLHI